MIYTVLPKNYDIEKQNPFCPQNFSTRDEAEYYGELAKKTYNSDYIIRETNAEPFWRTEDKENIIINRKKELAKEYGVSIENIAYAGGDRYVIAFPQDPKNGLREPIKVGSWGNAEPGWPNEKEKAAKYVVRIRNMHDVYPIWMMEYIDKLEHYEGVEYFDDGDIEKRDCYRYHRLSDAEIGLLELVGWYAGIDEMAYILTQKLEISADKCVLKWVEPDEAGYFCYYSREG